MRRKGLLALLEVLGVLSAALAIYEQTVLTRLRRRSDPGLGRSFVFPAERIHEIPTPDGGRLHVEECGAGQPIVVLHGHGGTLATFSLLAPDLVAAGLRVVAIDHRGFGRSSAVPPRFGFDGLVADVVTVLEALDLRGAIVVGHSMGGTVALGLALQHPDLVRSRVDGLVLLSSTARGPGDSIWMRSQVALLDWSPVERLGRHPRHGVVLTRLSFGSAPHHSHVAATWKIGLASPVAPRRGFARRLLGTDLRPALQRVDLPVLVLTGSRDRVVSPSQSERIAELIPHARLVTFPGAGHVLPFERADAVGEAIVAFAADL